MIFFFPFKNPYNYNNASFAVVSRFFLTFASFVSLSDNIVTLEDSQSIADTMTEMSFKCLFQSGCIKRMC